MGVLLCAPQWLSRARQRCRFSSSLHGWALSSASPRLLMCRLRFLAFQLTPTQLTPLLQASNRVPIQTQPTLLCAQIVLASREPSPVPLAMRFVLSITRRPAALEGRRGAPTKQLSQGTPTPSTPTMELGELTLGQEELTPMPLLTRELPSPTWLILRLQLSMAMLSNLTNGNKTVEKKKKKKKKKKK